MFISSLYFVAVWYQYGWQRFIFNFGASHIHTSPYLSIDWDQVTHICISKLTVIISDNGLAPLWRQSITWINDCILSVRLWGIYCTEILFKIQKFPITEMPLKITLCFLSRPQYVKSRQLKHSMGHKLRQHVASVAVAYIKLLNIGSVHTMHIFCVSFITMTVMVIQSQVITWIDTELLSMGPPRINAVLFQWK